MNIKKCNEKQTKGSISTMQNENLVISSDFFILICAGAGLSIIILGGCSSCYNCLKNCLSLRRLNAAAMTGTPDLTATTALEPSSAVTAVPDPSSAVTAAPANQGWTFSHEADERRIAFEQRFRAYRQGQEELLNNNARRDEIEIIEANPNDNEMEMVRTAVKAAVEVSGEAKESLQIMIITSPFEPYYWLIFPLSYANVNPFVLSLLSHVVIKAAKTLLCKNLRIHSIENTSVSQEHPYHLVDPSPWPLLGSLGALTSTIGAVLYMHSFIGDKILLTLGLNVILYTMFVWWRDVTCESTYEGHHTKVV